MATKALFNFFPPLPSALCLFTISSERKKPRGGSPSEHYRCSVCGKAFPSYQALGGHKSSHRRLPALPVASDTCSSGSASGNGAHQCSLCLRRFHSGQALGGHKRLHYWDATAAPSSSSFLSVNVRGFDLNLPPADQEEEEEVQSPLPRIRKRSRAATFTEI